MSSIYEAGLDILGAVGQARAQLRQLNAGATGKYAAAAQKLITAGKALHDKKMGAKFVRVGAAHLARAKAKAKKKQALTAAAAQRAASLASAAPPSRANTAAAAAPTVQRSVTEAPVTRAVAARAPVRPTALQHRSVMAGDGRVPAAPGQFQFQTIPPGGPTPPAAADGSDDTAPPSVDILTRLSIVVNQMGSLLEHLQPGVTGTPISEWNQATGYQTMTNASHVHGEDVFGDAASLVQEGLALQADLGAALDADAAALDAGQPEPATDWDSYLAQARDWGTRAQQQVAQMPAVDYGTAATSAQAGAQAAAAAAMGAIVPWTPNTPYQTMGQQVTNYGTTFSVMQPGTSGPLPGPMPSQSQYGQYGQYQDPSMMQYPQQQMPVQDGTVVWMPMAAQQPYMPPQGDYGGGGGGGGGGGDDGGGSTALPGDGEDDGGAPGGGGGEGGFDDGSSPLDSDLGTGGFAPPVDPFYDDDGGMSADDGSEGEDLLGIDFKTAYIFAPWQAGEDYQTEQQKASEGTGTRQSGITAVSTAPPPSPEQRARLITAARKLQAVQSQRLLHADNTVQPASAFTPEPSASFTSRLSSTRAALGTPGAIPSTDGVTVDGEAITEILMDDGEVVTDGWGVGITDEPADPERRTASLHHGAAYLEERAYPRGGASSGQEGGVMYPRETVQVFGANVGDTYDLGCDVLGAGPAPVRKPIPVSGVRFQKRTTAAGNTHVALVPGKPRGGAHKQSIANAKKVAARAISVGQKLSRAIAKGAAKPAATHATAVHGAVAPRGVAPRGAAVHRRGRRLGPAQLKAIADRTIKAGQDLKTHTGKYQTQVTASLAREKAGAAMLRASAAGHGTRIHGDSEEAAALMYGALEDVLGDEIMLLSEIAGYVSPPQPIYPAPGVPYQPAGAYQPYPPGGGIDPTTGLPYQTSGIDPATGMPYQAGGIDPTTGMPYQTGAIDPATGMPYDDYGTAAFDMNDPNAGQGEMPTLATLPPPLFTPGPDPRTDQTAYNSTTMGGLPEGAIIFDMSSRPLENKCFGSFNFMTHGPVGNGEGFYYQGDGGNGHWNGAWGSWVGVLSDWGNDAGRREETQGSKSALVFFQSKGNTVNLQNINGASLAAGWGPLIGNPDLANFKGLRYDAGGDQFFWFWDQAPDWAKAPGEALRLAQAITDWKTLVTAAKTDAATQAAQDQLDADNATALAKQQAAEDAQMSRQQDQENSMASHDADLQAKADEAAGRQQQLADESAARQAESQNELDIKAAQAQADIDRANQQQEYEQGERAYQAAQAAHQDNADASADAGGGGGGAVDPGDTGEFNLEEEALPDDLNLDNMDEYDSNTIMGSARLRAHTVDGKYHP